MKLDGLFPCIAFCQIVLVIYYTVKLPGNYGSTTRKFPQQTKQNSDSKSVPEWTHRDQWVFRNYVSRDKSTLSYWHSSPLLPRVLSPNEYSYSMKLLKAIAGIFMDANLTFLMSDGTLLGSFMMHDVLPWDDDLDLMVSFADMPRIKKLFANPGVDIHDTFQIRGHGEPSDEYSVKTLNSSHGPSQGNLTSGPPWGHKVTNKSMYHKFKFFYKYGQQAGDKPWKWPFVDVKYFLENSTHVWNLDFPGRVYHVKKTDFYPLHMRPLSGMWLPAPADTYKWLRVKYKGFHCRSSQWNHKAESQQYERRAKCKKLYKYYPVVWREQAEGGTREVLRFSNKVVRVEDLPETYVHGLRPLSL